MYLIECGVESTYISHKKSHIFGKKYCLLYHLAKSERVSRTLYVYMIYFICQNYFIFGSCKTVQGYNLNCLPYVLYPW